ncbi:MAG: hypothetical protein ACYDDF_14400 [Thermoplasmatota archaeon]
MRPFLGAGTPTDGRAFWPAYPVEALRDRYMTPFAGLTWQLLPGEVGVNVDALQANTHLEAAAHVLVSLSPPLPTPLVGRAVYRVVPLDATRPEALRLSPDGEAVFSAFETESEAARTIARLRPGDSIVLNAAIGRVFPRSGA